MKAFYNPHRGAALEAFGRQEYGAPVEASMDALERLYGIQIDYYLRINFSGFVDIIDALGGIDVNSEYEFTVEPIKTYHVGINHLTGLEALAFARERYSFADGDYQRAKNQMEVIRAVVAQCASSSLLKNYASVMNAVSGSFETNMPDDQIFVYCFSVSICGHNLRKDTKKCKPEIGRGCSFCDCGAECEAMYSQINMFKDLKYQKII